MRSLPAGNTLPNCLPTAERLNLKSPLRVVAIGGGTGLSTLLTGLKKHARGGPGLRPREKPLVEIAAVVTVSDDGGSSGRLRRDFDILPPGDIRNCMTALSEDEALLSQLFRYRPRVERPQLRQSLSDGDAPDHRRLCACGETVFGDPGDSRANFSGYFDECVTRGGAG